MLWFGEPWPEADRRAPVCESDLNRVPVPVGEVCLLCSTELAADARGVWIGYAIPGDSGAVRPVHVRCLLLNTVGQEITDTLSPDGGGTGARPAAEEDH